MGGLNGDWVLRISVDLAGDIGSLDLWSVDLTTCACQQPEADLALAKTVGSVGSQITWAITATNHGPADATGVVVTDPLDPCTVYLGDDCGAANVPPWTWAIGALAAGASLTCAITVDASACALGGVDVFNTATVTGDQDDPVPANNSATTGVPFDPFSLPAIPTLGPPALALLLLVLAGSALVFLRRRRAGS
jgi:uncharacterized repeat protein (TIGR01451 family)